MLLPITVVSDPPPLLTEAAFKVLSPMGLHPTGNSPVWCRSGAGVKNSLVSTLVSSIFWSLPFDISLDNFFSSPPHNMFCYPVESKWHPGGTGPPKPSIEFIHQSDGQVQQWQIVITTFLSGNSVLHITWILNKKNLEISQRMGH